MECEYPSTNDIIATPIGGAAIGEVLYRTSDLIIDDRTTGAERFGRELATFFVDPMRGITRLVTGRAWEKRASVGRRFGTPPISVELSLGARLMTMHNNYRTTKAGGVAELYIEYGDRFETSSNTPYSYFSFLMELQMMKTQPLLGRVEIIGRLLSREIVDHNRFNLSAGLYQHFDFFDSDTVAVQKERELTKPCVVPYKMGTPASSVSEPCFAANFQKQRYRRLLPLQCRGPRRHSHRLLPRLSPQLQLGFGLLHQGRHKLGARQRQMASQHS